MLKLYTILFSLLIPMLSWGALTIGNGGGATNITSTNAWITASVVSTGAANPYLYSYWGTNDGGTNVSLWKNTNSFGVCTQASYSFQAVGLEGSKIYYHRTRATNATEIAWSSYSAMFYTLSTPTTAPPSSVQAVTVDTNDVLKHPGSNFWVTNKVAILAGIGAITNFTDTNAVWGNITGALANQLDLTDTVAKASAAYPASNPSNFYLSSNPSNFVDATITNALNGVVATKVGTNDATYTNAVALAGLALQSGSPGTWTNLSEYNNDLPGVSTNLSVFNNDAGFVTISVTNDLNGVVATKASTTDLTAHTTNTANPHAVTAAQVGAVATNAAPYLNLLTNTATKAQGLLADTALQVETYVGTVTGGTVTAGAADTFVVTGPNAAITWNTNAAGGGGGAGTLTNIISSDSSVAVVNPGGPQPDLSVTNALAAYVPTNNVNLFTATEKSVATSVFSYVARTNAHHTTNNGVVYLDVDSGATNAEAGSAWGYDAATKTITIDTNDFGGGAGSGFPLTGPADLAGYNLTNGGLIQSVSGKFDVADIGNVTQWNPQASSVYLPLAGGDMSGALGAPVITNCSLLTGTWVTNVQVVTTVEQYVVNSVLGWTYTTNNVLWNREGAWTEFSFTSSVPNGAARVTVFCDLTPTNTGKYFQFADTASTNLNLRLASLVAGVQIAFWGDIILDSNRACVYYDNMGIGTSGTERMRVNGWWIPVIYTNWVTLTVP